MNQSPEPARPPWGWPAANDLRKLRAGLEQMLAALIGGRGGQPEVELNSTGDGYTVVARLPGVAPEEVAVDVGDRELCIRARTGDEVDADNGIADGGGSTRAFAYRIDLPADVDLSRIDAVMDHGLLTISLPRGARPARRTIVVGRRQFEPGRLGTGHPPPNEPGRRPLNQPGDEPAPAGQPGHDLIADRELHRQTSSFPSAGGQLGW